MIIRIATQNDVHILSNLAIMTYTDAFGHSMQSSDIIAHLDHHLLPHHFASMLENNTILVAERQAQLVGFVQVGDMLDTSLFEVHPDQEVRRLYVRSLWQRQGIRTLLLEHALMLERVKQAGQIFLDVWEQNKDARRLYERFGFQVIGERPFVVVSGAATTADLVMVRQSQVKTASSNI